MDIQAQHANAEAFRQLHDRSRILLLPNAWDAASARIFEDAGFNAVATTSAGVAYTAGYPDGEAIPRDDMVTIVRWIAHSVKIPVTADIESGFGNSPREVGDTVRMIIEAGAVGVNLEDIIHDAAHGAERQLYDLPSAVERIRAARAAAEAAGVPIVIMVVRMCICSASAKKRRASNMPYGGLTPIAKQARTVYIRSAILTVIQSPHW
jgi:2-methylisocitrate lyase-like PEP mutase family enzyme